MSYMQKHYENKIIIFIVEGKMLMIYIQVFQLLNVLRFGTRVSMYNRMFVLVELNETLMQIEH